MNECWYVSPLFFLAHHCHRRVRHPFLRPFFFSFHSGAPRIWKARFIGHLGLGMRWLLCIVIMQLLSLSWTCLKSTVIKKHAQQRWSESQIGQTRIGRKCGLIWGIEDESNGLNGLRFWDLYGKFDSSLMLLGISFCGASRVASILEALTRYFRLHAYYPWHGARVEYLLLYSASPHVRMCVCICIYTSSTLL